MAGTQWIGYMVSIDGGERGMFQGEIVNATATQISLRKVFCDGVPHDPPEIVLDVSEIYDLKLIEKLQISNESSTVTIAKPVAKRAGGRSHTVSESSAAVNKSQSSNQQQQRLNNDQNKSVSSSNKREMNKKDKDRRQQQHKWKDEACFGSPLDSTIDKDFDFEKNLALFDKQAVYEEINSTRPDLVKNTERHGKYRHDENIIEGGPAMYRQISVPKKECQEYFTDEGLIVPTIPRALRSKLFQAAEKLGLTWERQNELMGRAATEISLQLLGGGHRLNPKNTHQYPTVVILTNSSRTGSIGINTGRQLASHGIKTLLFATNSEMDSYKMELSIYKHTKNKIVSSVSGLPHIADLIIVAFGDEASEPMKGFSNLLEWTNNNRAPVLAIDPAPNGTLGLTSKFSLVPVMPLAHSTENGKIYLCNLGVPVQAFIDVNIKYQSPFGSKFIIPLYPVDSET